MHDGHATADRHHARMMGQPGHGGVCHVLVPLMRGHAKRGSRPGLVSGNTDGKKRSCICALKTTQVTACIGDGDGRGAYPPCKNAAWLRTTLSAGFTAASCPG